VLIEFAEHFDTDGKQISVLSLRLEQCGQTVLCPTQIMSRLYLDAKMSPSLQVNSGTEPFCMAIFFLSASWYLLPATLFLLALT